MKTQRKASMRNDLRWPVGLRLSHWMMALSVLAASGLAIYLRNPPSWSEFYIQRYKDWIDIHKVVGLIALAAVIALAIQHRRRPARRGSQPEQLLARIAQGAMIVLVIIAALSGYLASSLFGNPIAIPGLPPLASPFPRVVPIARFLNSTHIWSTYGVLVLIAGHVTMAIWRQVFANDPVISRILGLKPSDRLKAPD